MRRHHDGTRRRVPADEFLQRAVPMVAAAAPMALARPNRGGLQPAGPIHEDYYYYYYPYDDYPPEESKFIGIIPWAWKIIKWCAFGFLLLSSSAICYGVFYWAIMPGSYASRPLFFDYTGTAPYPHLNVTLTTNTNDNDNSCNQQVATADQSAQACAASSTTSSAYSYSPWATVDLFVREQAVVWGAETLHDEALPPLETQNRVMQPGQAYYVELHLTLPETSLNRDIGMFGVAVDLLSDANDEINNSTTLRLASSVRPARLPHESGWVAVARKTLWLLPIIFGGMQESRVVVIPSFRHIVESKNYPLRHVVVRLVSQPQTSGSYFAEARTATTSDHQPPTQPIEVIRGEVRIGKELNVFQETLKEFFYTCYIVGTMMFFSLHFAAYGLFEYYWNQAPQEDYPYGGDTTFDFHGDHGGNNNNHGDDDADGFENIDGNDNNEGSFHPDDEDGVNSSITEEADTTHFGHDDDDDPDDWEECPPDNNGRQAEAENIGVHDTPTRNQRPPSSVHRRRRADRRGQQSTESRHYRSHPPAAPVPTGAAQTGAQPDVPPTGAASNSSRRRKRSARREDPVVESESAPTMPPTDSSVPSYQSTEEPRQRGFRNGNRHSLGTWVDSALEVANAQGMPVTIREESKESASKDSNTPSDDSDDEEFFDCLDEVDNPTLGVDHCDEHSSTSDSFSSLGRRVISEPESTASRSEVLLPTFVAAGRTGIPGGGSSESTEATETDNQQAGEINVNVSPAKPATAECPTSIANVLPTESPKGNNDVFPTTETKQGLRLCSDCPQRDVSPIRSVVLLLPETETTNQQHPGEVSSSTPELLLFSPSSPPDIQDCEQNESDVPETVPVEETLHGAVFKVPEAQVLDSFLADLINPFLS